MKELKLTLELVTPMMVGGADARGNPELRGAPFRGVLRYWLRAIVGADTSINRSTLSESEMGVFGSTEVGSLLNVCVSEGNNAALQINDRDALPHRNGNPRRRVPTSAFIEGQSIFLELQRRVGLGRLPDEALKALLMWLTFGGIGKRSRRGFGSLRCARVEGDTELLLLDDYRQLLTPGLPADGSALADQATAVLTKVLGAVTRSTAPITVPALGTPGLGPAPFPALQAGRWMVLVCHKPFNTYENAMKDFWNNHLRASMFINDPKFGGEWRSGAFGYARGRNRRASPLHLHISRSKEGYHLVLTALNAEPGPSGNSWTLIHKLFESCRKAYGGVVFT